MLRHTVPLRNDPVRLLCQHLGDDRLRGGSNERRIADEHLVQHASERINICARVERPFPHRLLGAHVSRRAEAHPGFGHPRAAGGARGERDPEVGDKCVPAVQQDILRLDVAVDHAVIVRVLQGAGHFGGDADRVRDRQLPLAGQPVAQRFAVHKGHHVEHGAVHLAGIVQREDVRMLQIGRRADLGEESGAADHRRELRFQHFDRDLAVVLQVVGEIHRGHSAGAEFALDAVAVSEG